MPERELFPITPHGIPMNPAHRQKEAKPQRSPHIPSLHITSRAEIERSELPKDGPTPGLDAPFTLPLTAGKGEPEKPRKTLFRKP